MSREKAKKKTYRYLPSRALDTRLDVSCEVGDGHQKKTRVSKRRIIMPDGRLGLLHPASEVPDITYCCQHLLHYIYEQERLPAVLL